MLSAEQITQNWEALTLFIKNNFSGERGKVLYDFYDKYADRIALMPASGKISYHNAFAGGYVDHILRVVRLSKTISDLWEDAGAVIDFTDEERNFVALNHDLGKFGDIEHEEYIIQDSKWHSERGEVYKHNPDINFMKTSERSLFLLQQLGIPLTQNEYLGIKLHDGLYEEGNKGYYIAFSEEYRLRSNLPYIIHQADLLATRIEHDNVGKPIANDRSQIRIVPETHVPPHPSKKVSTPVRSNGSKFTKDISQTAPPPSPKPANKKFSSLLSTI